MIGAEDFRHIALGDVQSTNLECLERARAGDPGNLWITADRQLGGRARRGRSWISEPGNLYASLLLIDPAPPPALASLPLAVAVAVHAAVAAALPLSAPVPTIKWPNDVLVGGAKISGILLESEALANKRHAVVIGCGINVAHAPDHAAYPTTTLRVAGSTLSPDELFAKLCLSMARNLQQWDGGRGIETVRRAWLECAQGVGEHITVNLTDRSITGRFKEIDASGCLVMDGDDGRRRTIAAGDIFFN